MLTILSVAYPLAAVSRDALGGAEQVLSAVDAALVAAGHRSLVIARGDSSIAGELVPLPIPPRLFDYDAMCAAHEHCRAAIGQTLARTAVDLVHLHGTDLHWYLPSSAPTMATLHLWPDCYPSSLLQRTPANVTIQCVSEAQHRACPCAGNVHVVPNGVDTDRWRPNGTKGDYALTLCRICPEKGIHLAIEACGRAGRPLQIAGIVFPFATHVQYFEQQIAPRLDGNVRFMGAAVGDRKRALLASARCLLLPSIVPETSSLVAMEALASGTPVVAFRTPALEELIEDGRNGFLVSDAMEMSEAIDRIGEIRPEACRGTALEQCGVDRMTAGYLREYQAIVAGVPQ